MDHLSDKNRAARVEQRALEYIHRSKRMIMENFGTESGPEHVKVVLALATAMIHLESAEIGAVTQDRIAEILESQEI
ncbi:hypothetical protein [Parasulfitobacter algicola]|uniref:Cell division protein ZapA n=1 Tax=Parasulfitobacter algicola TaxID=2614809 RepID=A0ABX2ISV8_9RHOB|nr:hypothetical protein [Sulfitobacter algicola]NSX55994.1 hypothetical protein [Sulfitobacter algicola]